MTPQGGGTPAAATWLQEALAGGAAESNRLKAAATDAGISPKALRLARERLGIVTTRSGRRATMRSTWELPAGAGEGSAETRSITAAVHPREAAPTATLAKPAPQAVPLSTGVKDSAGMLRNVDVSQDDGLLPGEHRRVAQRIERFVKHGMKHAAAQSLAVRLILERDRTNSREGSCLECSVLEDGRCLPGMRGDTPGPRPPTEIWMCWCARRD